jgi:TRAP-type C4-dicarboxylate transport system permease small subunit
MTRVFGRLAVLVERLENALITLFTAILVVLAGGQIAARELFGGGWLELEAFLRTMVLWLALLGAMVAAREDKHLAVDAISRYLHGSVARAMRVLAYLGAAVVCALLTWYSWQLVTGEREAGTIAFANVPAWITEAIMPIAFGVMALRFAVHALLPPRQPTAADRPA